VKQKNRGVHYTLNGTILDKVWEIIKFILVHTLNFYFSKLAFGYFTTVYLNGLA